MAKKKRRKPNLKNPNSMTWRIKADTMWADVIKQVGYCEHCGSRNRQLNAHHLLHRNRFQFRHDVSNGVCLCVQCHAFDDSISPHIDSFSGEKFLRWLEQERPGQYLWYAENKDNRQPKEKTYEESYYELKAMYEELL